MIKWSEDIATENLKLFKENRDARMSWERDAIRFENFRYMTHFSPSEEQELLAFRQAPLPISVTTAICDTAEALMVASKPTISVAPIVFPGDQAKSEVSRKVSSLFNQLIQKSWYDSLGALQHDRVIRDSSNVGHGLYYIVPRNEYNEFTVDIKHISWKHVYPHAFTRDPFYRDMDNCVIAMDISREYGYKFVAGIDPSVTYERYMEEFTKIKESLSARLADPYRAYGKKENVIPFINRIVLEQATAYIIVPMDVENPSDNEVRVVREITEEHEKLAKENKINIRTRKEFFLTEYLSIGAMGYKRVYPITKYNIVPLVYDHRDSPYPHGRIYYLYPLQRALNKFMMIAILNGSLTNILRVMAEEGSITDVAEFKKSFALPGSVLQWRNAIPGYTKPPQIIEAKPLSDAWLAMPQYLTNMMEYISGIFGVMMGDSRDTPNVFSTVATLQSAGGQKIKRRLAASDAALSVVGEIVGEFYKEYAPINGFATSLDDKGQETPPVMYNQIRVKEDGDIDIDPTTDLRTGFKTIRFTSQSSSGFEASTEAALLTNLATQLKIPQIAPLILKRLNIPDMDDVLKAIDVTQQQQGTIDALTKQIQELEHRTTLMANNIATKSFELTKAQYDAKFEKALNGLTQTEQNPNG